MREFFKDLETRRNIFVYSASGIIIFLFITVIHNIDTLNAFLSKFLGIVAPFVWGLIFAFFLIGFADKVESILPSRLSFKRKRSLSTLASIVLLLCVICVFISLIVPQLTSSFVTLSNQIIAFVQNNVSGIDFSDIGLSEELTKTIIDYAKTAVSVLWSAIQSSIPNIVNATVNTVTAVINFVIGIIVATYVLTDREHLMGIIRKTCRALCSDKIYTDLAVLYNITIVKLLQFFKGKIIDSLIVGIICFVFMIAAGLEYPLLISVIIGITNIIPFFGPFIGAVPCALILLIVSPIHALIFVIFVLILQQIDGNVIGPKILGDSVGLSSIWIMFAILIGSGYFGFAGMILGVPLFSVFYILATRYIERKLSDKGFDPSIDTYTRYKATENKEATKENDAKEKSVKFAKVKTALASDDKKQNVEENSENTKKTARPRRKTKDSLDESNSEETKTKESSVKKDNSRSVKKSSKYVKNK